MLDFQEFIKTHHLEDDLRHMREYLQDYAHTDRDVSIMPMEQYLEDWYTAKSQYLLKLFGDKLIIEEPIEYTASDEELRHNMRSLFFDTPDWEIEVCSVIRAIMRTLRNADGLAESINFSYYLLERLQTYVENSLPEPIHAELPGVKPFKAPAGTKPFKAIRKLVNFLKSFYLQKHGGEDAEEMFSKLEASIERCRIFHSQCLNTKNLAGTLCLSIHPLDYVTMSDNGYDWDSCMKWVNDAGDYRVGTLEMMNSPSVIVAYLKGSKPWEPCNSGWEWNNKRWRQLFIIERNFITGIKGYPYSSPGLTSAICLKLAERCEERLEYPLYLTPRSTKEEGFHIGKHSVIFYTNAMYNDIKYNDVIYMPTCDPNGVGDYFNYSGVVRCLQCGDTLELSSDYNDCSSPFCDDCVPHMRCYNCGSTIDQNDNYEEIDGELYCEDCYCHCEICEDAILNTDSESVVLVVKDEDDNDDLSYHYLCTCQSCKEDEEDNLVEMDLFDIKPLHTYRHQYVNVATPSISDRMKDAIRYCYGKHYVDKLVDPRNYQNLD